MTDKDIIKALEFESTPSEINCVHTECIEAVGFYCGKKRCYAENCMECKEHTMDYNGNRAKAILDLINRKNAEIEELYREVDRLIIAKDQLFDEAEALIKKAKAEAIKEFAERVKALFPFDKKFTTISRFALRQIAKEMGVE